jgi:hypothetical protein
LGTKVAIDEPAHFVGGVVDLLAVQDGEGVDLLHDVAHVHGGGGRAARLHLVAQARRSSAADLVEQPV